MPPLLQNLGLIEESKIRRPIPLGRPENVECIEGDIHAMYWYVLWVCCLNSFLEGNPTNMFDDKFSLSHLLIGLSHSKSCVTQAVGLNQYSLGQWGDDLNVSYGALPDHQVTC